MTYYTSDVYLSTALGDFSYWYNKFMATAKQKLALQKITENHGNISRGMIEAGYTPHTASKPKNLTDSKGFQELLDEAIPDCDMIRVLQNGMENAFKILLSPAAGTLEVEDFAVKLAYLKEAAKLKNKYPKEEDPTLRAQPVPILQSISITQNVYHHDSHEKDNEPEKKD